MKQEINVTIYANVINRFLSNSILKATIFIINQK